jgi:formylglycine-generating enzyme required for sulfatase activity
MHHDRRTGTSQASLLRVVLLAIPGMAAATGIFVALPRQSTAPAPHESVPPSPTSAAAPSSATVVVPAPSAPIADDDEPTTLVDQRARLFRRMREALKLGDDAMSGVERVFAASPYLGQGNPAISKHPMTRAECRAARSAASVVDADDPRCGAPGMVAVPGHGEPASAAHVCIDRLEFPGIACEYPVVNVRSSEAAELCHAVGKRLCDAHEWEGACAGALNSADGEYMFPRARPEVSQQHNTVREKVWAYGPERDLARCATGSRVTPGCPGGGWDLCGSNTYPTGAFPACRSPLGVYDQHGNVAEHMSMPRTPDELGARGGLGETEMKGSWFVFASTPAHEDDCRWRAPAWHATRIDAASSHRNYHLGFRCCRDVE